MHLNRPRVLHLITALFAGTALALWAAGQEDLTIEPKQGLGKRQHALLVRGAAENARQAEAGLLQNHVQLTFPDRFIKAGEAYFSPDDSRIIFQAIETAPEGADPEPFYQMYVAELVRGENGLVQELTNLRRLSPEGSSNTCGWFHPTRPDHVIFGSTVVKPKNPAKVGFQREKKDYAWFFPQEMDIVMCNLETADGSAESLQRLVTKPDAYLAECAISPDGRYLVYCERPIEDDQLGGDLKVMDLESSETFIAAGNSGYDGGPFFSPDGTRICYRSDRVGNDLLQVFVAELETDEYGNVLGVEREFQLTDNAHVNWAPFWHPQGLHLLYTTSQMGHHNYEVFLLDADPGDPQSDRPTRYGTRKRRVTHAEGFDGLPVFNSEGSLMMWTSQRGEGGSSQLWLAEFVLDLEGGPDRMARIEPAEQQPTEVHTADPESGLIYIYDRSTHQLMVYDPSTHQKKPVTDPSEKERAMRLFRAGEEHSER